MDLREYFTGKSGVAIGLSGGADSALLLWAARKYAEDVTPFFASTVFGHPGDRESAETVCGLLGLDLRVVEVDLESDPDIMSNGPDRCYHCKRRIFGAILEAAHRDGCRIVVDGTNASDDVADRPGFQALGELGIVSPLRECGLTKDDIRRMSREAGLPTWDRPSNSCLATRMVTGIPIDLERIRDANLAEEALRSMGYEDHRVRTDGSVATVVLRRDQVPEDEEARRRIVDVVSEFMGETVIGDETR